MKRSEINFETQRLYEAKLRWAHRGRLMTGADCIGMVILVGERFGVPYVDVPDYSHMPDGKMFVSHIQKFLDPGELPLKIGQVVVQHDERLPCHCGIITQRYGELRFTHSSIRNRRVIETRIDADFWSRFVTVLEFPGIEEG